MASRRSKIKAMPNLRAKKTERPAPSTRESKSDSTPNTRGGRDESAVSSKKEAPSPICTQSKDSQNKEVPCTKDSQNKEALSTKESQSKGAQSEKAGRSKDSPSTKGGKTKEAPSIKDGQSKEMPSTKDGQRKEAQIATDRQVEGDSKSTDKYVVHVESEIASHESSKDAPTDMNSEKEGVLKSLDSQGNASLAKSPGARTGNRGVDTELSTGVSVSDSTSGSTSKSGSVTCNSKGLGRDNGSDVEKRPAETKPKTATAGRRSRFTARPNIGDTSKTRPNIGDTSKTRQNIGDTSKTRQNIGDTSKTRSRTTSVGTSDTEDDSKKLTVPHSPVKTKPTLKVVIEEQVMGGETTVVTSERAGPSPVTETIQPRVRRISERNVIPEPVKRKPRKSEKLDLPIDRSKITMKDLIFMNPVANPMKTSDDLKKRKKELSPETVSVEETPAVKPTVTALPEPAEVESPGNNDEAMPMPQVKIGPNGDIIINEESLVLDQPEEEDPMDSEAITETDMLTTYASFRPSRRTKSWCDRETKQFYMALSYVGTDFSLMCDLFPKRTRLDLKLKFKKEEKHNRHLIDKAITDPIRFDQKLFDQLTEEIKTAALKKTKGKTTRKRKQKKVPSEQRKKKQKKYYEDSGAEEESPAVSDEQLEDRVARAEASQNTAIIVTSGVNAAEHSVSENEVGDLVVASEVLVETTDSPESTSHRKTSHSSSAENLIGTFLKENQSRLPNTQNTDVPFVPVVPIPGKS